MGFNCGIVGLPNVGKSTLFNALTATAAAESANYPFCTIEPNTGRVSVPDSRLDQICKIAGSLTTIPATLEFVDIAGLVKGASKGEGLGNKFLGNIRQVDAIIHMIRCFEDENITHVENSIDPIRDKEIIETELMIADLESLEKRLVTLDKKIRAHDDEALVLKGLYEKCIVLLSEGKPARLVQPSEAEKPLMHHLQLLTQKPVLYVCNVAESDVITGNAHVDQLKAIVAQENAPLVLISAAIEAEVANLDDETEKTEFLETLGLTETGLKQIVRAGYALLGLQTYFTAGPKEARAWTFPKGATAPEAAGVIHTDFKRGFICAETISFEPYVAFNGEQGAKSAGKWRQEGKEYVVKDGDVILFRFNV